LETFHHCLLGIFVGIGEEILEELVKRAVAAHVGIFRACFRLFRLENRLSDIVPVLTRLGKGRPGLRGWNRDACGVGERIRGISYKTTPASLGSLHESQFDLDFSNDEA